MSNSRSLPQRSKPLYEQAYLALRSAILSGEIGVDERLVETQLAERFQVSRTPIREAIRRLQQESLLASDADGRLYVVKLSLHDAIKLYDCRIALEQLAVVGACEHATKEQLKAIEQTLVQAEAIAKQDNPQSNQLLDLNFQFHRLIAESSDNPWLVPILDQLSNQTTLLRIQTLQDDPDVTDIHAEHHQIYEAIARQDSKAALKHITYHLSVSQKRIVQIFEQLGETQSAPNMASTSCQPMKCPRCHSPKVSRNGHRMGKQNYICRQCNRQFLATYEQVGYPNEVREKCLALHQQGVGFREIERLTGVNHNTVIRWVKLGSVVS
ncbi:MAG: hypothetical protein Kow00121_00860 [Elainellaceae cyanobacterium]